VPEEKREEVLQSTNQQFVANMLELIEYYKEEEHRPLQQHLVWALINATRNRDDLKESFCRLSMPM
jgi:hypothetical protein